MGQAWMRVEKLRSWLRRAAWADGLLVLLVAALVYLPLAGQFGYYRDDWHVAWAGRLFGSAKIVDLHLTDRPVMGVLYSLAYSALGDAPLAWQLYAFCLRAAGAVTFLWLLRLLWPGRRLPTLVMALLFVLYPGFLQMPTASAYSNHLFGLWMGILSIALSLRALAFGNGRRWLLTGLAVVSGLACFAIMEYMISLEVMRLLLFGFLGFAGGFPPLAGGSTLPARGLRLLRAWLPYLAGLGLFLAWRVLVFKSARSVTDVGSLARLYLAEPGAMLGRLVIETLKGFLNALVLAWGVPFYNLTADAGSRDLLVSALLALLVVATVLGYARLVRRGPGAPERPENGVWAGQAVELGLLVALANLLPIVLANRDVRLTDTFDRYTLPASLGVVMVVTGLLDHVKPALRAALLAGVLSLCVITHYQNAVYFRNFWEFQRQLWWQLSWRAPGLEKDTLLIPVLPENYLLAESYEAWGPANIIYGAPEDPQRVAGEALNDQTLLFVQTRQNFTRTVRRVEVPLDFKNSLVVSLAAPGSCVKVIDGRWLELGDTEDTRVRLAAPYSRTDLIETGAGQHAPPVEIFGPEPAHGWCYYFQKASLARQEQDWQEVVRLGEEVLAGRLSPQNSLEWLPFYQGYAYASILDRANQIAWLIRDDRLALEVFCSQFEPGDLAALRAGSLDEFIIVNLCPALGREETRPILPKKQIELVSGTVQ
jgi:hypothetical protein